MKKQLLALLLFTCTAVYLQAQSVSGRLVDAESGEPLIGASVIIDALGKGASSNFDGYFMIPNVPAGTHTMKISYVGYGTTDREIQVGGDENNMGVLKIASTAIGLNEVQVVASIAIDRKTPVAVSTIPAEIIELKLGNQEFPEILKTTPSIYATKQGGGAGDAVNGMEDNRVYWSNWAGLGDVTRTMQIQRGLGASRLAVASVGGTINIITKTTDQIQGGNIFTSFGNDGYRKTGITLSTGRTDNGWALTFSGSRTTGDGYIEGAYIDAWSYFGSIAKELGDNQQLIFSIFGAPQKHGQRDFAHSINSQENVYGKRWNDDFGYYQGSPFLFRENFYHKPQANLNHIWQVDEKSSLVTAIYGSTGRGGGTGDLGSLGGRSREYRQAKDQYGHQQFDQFRLYNTGQDNSLYSTSLPSMNYVMGGTNDTLSGQITSQGDGLIKRASMNEHQWFGLLSTYNNQLTSTINLNAGLDLRTYRGAHYRKTIDLFGGDYWFDDDNINERNDWVDLNGDGIKDADEMGNLIRPTNDADKLFGSVDDDQKIDYHNDETINWYGVFAGVEYSKDKLSAFLSGAVNSTSMRRYDYFNKIESENTTDWLNFIGGNIKLGANYNIDSKHNVFANVGFISRAPYFDALFPTFNNDEVNEDAKNESVMAVELGYGFRESNLKANINAYYTNWSDKTEVSDFEDADDNVYFLNLLGVDAVHSGVEFDLTWLALDKLRVNAFAGLNNWEWSGNPTGTISDENQNVIGETTLFLDGLKVGDAAQTTAGIGLDYDFGYGLSADIQVLQFANLYTNYSPDDRDREANSDLQPLKLPDYTLTDLGVTWKFNVAGLDARARLNINNLFNVSYIADAVDNVWSDDLNDTRGWFGFGRTFNLGMKVSF